MRQVRSYFVPANRNVQTVEEWGKVSAGASAQLADLYPVLQRLPNFLFPTVRQAEHVHKVGSELYTNHWLNAKEDLEKGTGLVCYSISFVLLSSGNFASV